MLWGGILIAVVEGKGGPSIGEVEKGPPRGLAVRGPFPLA